MIGVCMTTSTMHIMIRSSIPGAGVTDGHGDHGAAGMDLSGDGITRMHGITGDGVQVGIMDGIMADITGITEDTLTVEELSPTEVLEPTSAPTLSLMVEMQAFQEEHLRDAPMALHHALLSTL